ncbi:uncharacterized protein KQ657_000353 [Scheffersomyces spartinae]|uniref:Uncharacterized protein n=1 Tax=Scheffersomyces spartinae TaxID=45513 RepID=A0A9P7V9A4_9ASCO|nr:uncharacterized protein KQ657_000353 [Scheffersomyces spartinae]KAG7193668.1 hypothetical protein KQ657_000353 [Scheffersomyces spartinae]
MFSSEYIKLKNELQLTAESEQERQHMIALVIMRIAFGHGKSEKEKTATPPPPSSSSLSSSASLVSTEANVRHLVELEVSKIKQQNAMKIQTQEAKIQTQEARIRSLDKELKKLRQGTQSKGSTSVLANMNYLSPTINSFNKSILSSSPVRHVMTPLKRPNRITKDAGGKRKYLNYNKIAQTLTRTQRLERRRKEIDGESDTSRISEVSDDENMVGGSPTPESPHKAKKIRLPKTNSQLLLPTRTTLGEDDLNSIGYYQDANFTDVSPVRQPSTNINDSITVDTTQTGTSIGTGTGTGTGATSIPEAKEQPKKKRNIFEIE